MQAEPTKTKRAVECLNCMPHLNSMKCKTASSLQRAILFIIVLTTLIQMCGALHDAYAAQESETSSKETLSLVDGIVRDGLKNSPPGSFWSFPTWKAPDASSQENPSCRQGEFNGYPMNSLDFAVEGQHISIPIKIRYKLTDIEGEPKAVSLQHTIVLDMTEFKKSYIQTLRHTAQTAIDQFQSCQKRAGINSVGLMVSEPNAYGHLKVDFDLWNCWREERTGAKGENRVDGGKFEIHTTMTPNTDSHGLKLIHNVDPPSITLGSTLEQLKRALKDILAATRPISERLFGSLEENLKIKLPDVSAPDLSNIDSVVQSEIQKYGDKGPFETKLVSAAFLAEDPLLPREPYKFELFPSKSTPDGFYLKVIRSQSLMRRTACAVRKRIDDTKNRVPEYSCWFFSCTLKK